MVANQRTQIEFRFAARGRASTSLTLGFLERERKEGPMDMLSHMDDSERLSRIVEDAIGTKPAPVLECLVDLGLSDSEIARFLHVAEPLVQQLATPFREAKLRPLPYDMLAAKRRRRLAVQKRASKYHFLRFAPAAQRLGSI